LAAHPQSDYEERITGAQFRALAPRWRIPMAESVYKVIELVGTSTQSWEKAATAAVNRASKSLRDLRIAEVSELDMQLDDKGKVRAYRAKVKVSFKYEGK
jgi:dodecin